MIRILALGILPCVVAVLGLFPSLARRLPKTAAILMLLQIPVALWACRPAFQGDPTRWGAFGIDGIGAVFTCITTLVAAASMAQAAFLLPAERDDHPISDRRFGLYYTLTGLFVLAMLAVPLAQHLGFMWIALEATTLLSAPLVDYHHSASSLEATWKYLVLCSVGIAFALFGTIILFAAQHSAGATATFSIPELMRTAGNLDPKLLHVGFALCLLGYGTKAGVFPLHNWLPDAHSEAPAHVSAMLSGALLNCALVAIWRVSQIAVAAGQADYVRALLVPAGTITVVAAGLMLVRQHDLKRMWAYSSVEHVGLLIVAIGLGAGPIFMLHAFNHSLAKAALFLMSGNILQVFGTKSLSKVGGILRSAAGWGVVLVAAGFAIAGSPPFGTFLSEWMLLKTGFERGQTFAVVGLLAGLTVAFLAIASHLSPIVFGSDPDKGERKLPRRWVLSPAALLVVSLVAGLAVTPNVVQFLESLVGVATN